MNAEYGEDVGSIIKGLVKTNELYSKSPAIESENFRNLLLSFAEDMRVILIMIADRVNIMRQIKDTGNEEDRVKVANEAAYLYAPLAHKLGLYKLKSELEDLSLKYTQRETYYFIKEKLNETKASRDKYIASFIDPIQKKVKEAGLKFDIKGRTKPSIPSGIRFRSRRLRLKVSMTCSLSVSFWIPNRTRPKKSRNAGRSILS